MTQLLFQQLQQKPRLLFAWITVSEDETTSFFLLPTPLLDNSIILGVDRRRIIVCVDTRCANGTPVRCYGVFLQRLLRTWTVAPSPSCGWRAANNVVSICLASPGG